MNRRISNILGFVTAGLIQGRRKTTRGMKKTDIRAARGESKSPIREKRTAETKMGSDTRLNAYTGLAPNKAEIIAVSQAEP